MRFLKFVSRGLGADYVPGCFLCESSEIDSKRMMCNLSGFVESKEDGEEVVKMFSRGAWLDYREREPNWIQVKVGACKEHEGNLSWLSLMTHASHNKICREMVEDAARFKIVESAR